jgi:polyferredoxin
MKRTSLKYMRVIIALPFFILLAVLFIDLPLPIPDLFREIATRLQVVPSVLFLLSGISAVLVLLLFVFFLTLLFGRIYCSTICPLGTFQDIISRIARRFKKRKIFGYTKAHHVFRYTLLAVVVASVFTDSAFLLNLLDPYSNFGKIWSDLIRPVYMTGNNLLVQLLAKANIYSLPPVDIKQAHWATYIYPAVFLIAILIMASFRGRFFCNTLCPVGSSLGLISKISILQIKVDHETCTRCGQCSMVCKAECIDVKNKTLDFSRCVGCFNCINACQDDSINYKSAYKKKKNELSVDENQRRAFLGKLILFFTGSTLLPQELSALGKSNKKLLPHKKDCPVSPPGSLSISNFTSRCTACHLCVSACPTHVLKPSLFEYGWSGMMQPHMDFQQSFCNYECTSCSEVCPTGAIMPLSVERKVTTQIGVVHFIKEKCIVYTDGTSCGACSEHCPTKAVHMVPYRGLLKIPKTNVDICIGCGGCEYVCPARPEKAIFVNGNTDHKIAKKPVIGKNREKIIQDFPF